MAAATAPAPVKEPVNCAHPGCPSVFTPRTKDHKYCSTQCKRRSHTYRHVLRRT